MPLIRPDEVGVEWVSIVTEYMKPLSVLRPHVFYQSEASKYKDGSGWKRVVKALQGQPDCAGDIARSVWERTHSLFLGQLKTERKIKKA